MNEEKQGVQFRYPNNIEGIAQVFNKRSNSIANTYVLGLQERSNQLYANQFEGALVCLVQRGSDQKPVIGLPLPKEMFEAIAYNIRMVYCGTNIMLGVVQKDRSEEFVVQSSNWIGQDFAFSILKVKGASK